MPLFAISIASRGGAAFSSTPLQDICTAAFCAMGLLLLAVAVYLTRRQPEAD